MCEGVYVTDDELDTYSRGAEDLRGNIIKKLEVVKNNKFLSKNINIELVLDIVKNEKY